MSFSNRRTKDFEMIDGSTYPAVILDDKEKYLLDQLLLYVTGRDPGVMELVAFQKPDITDYLGSVMYKHKQSFVGMRGASNAISGVPLSGQHIDPLVLNWANNPANTATPQWLKRADDATEFMDGVTIAEDIYPCIIGTYFKRDMTLTNTAGANYANFFDRVRFTINDTKSMNYSLYAGGTVAADTTPITYIPFLPLPEQSTYTEEWWLAGSFAHDTHAHYLQHFGFTFGLGGVIKTIGT